MTDRELLCISAEVRRRAYTPYSKFAVGAALLAGDGRVFTGCNIENISFGLTICAERVAVGCAVKEGTRDFQLLALTSDSNQPVLPCGACRQVLAEFASDLRIISSTENGAATEFWLGALLPLPRQGILG